MRNDRSVLERGGRIRGREVISWLIFFYFFNNVVSTFFYRAGRQFF
jgi:hypothetical protein